MAEQLDVFDVIHEPWDLLALIHRKIGRLGSRDRPSIREKCLSAREDGGCETNPCPLRKAPFRCAHLRTAQTGFW